MSELISAPALNRGNTNVKWAINGYKVSKIQIGDKNTTQVWFVRWCSQDIGTTDYMSNKFINIMLDKFAYIAKVEVAQKPGAAISWSHELLADTLD